MAGTVITKKGMRLLVKLLATKGMLNLTRVAVGTGIIPSGYDPASMIDLAQYKMDGLISGCKVDGDIAKITTQISSVGIETGFTITEMGIFAEEPDTGEEILYTYLDMKDDPQYIYAEGGQAQKFVEITLDITIETETRVTTYINPQSMITRGEFMENMEKKVDAEGGDIADTKVSDATETTVQYPVPEKKDTVKVILGKLIKFCNDVKSGMCKISDIVNNCTSTATNKTLAANQGKVLMDKITEAVSALTTHKTSGDHDGRYYTETEIDTKLGGKSNTGHTHDDRYYTESEMDTKLNGKANSGHTHSAATESAAGLMSADDKKKLNGVAASANNYTHPSSHSASMINQDTSHRFVTDTEKNTWNGKAAGNHSHSGMLTTSDLVDNCTSTATNKAPTAKQAKLLMDKYNQLNSDLKTIIILKKFTKSGAFSQYGAYNVPMDIPSGYGFIGVSQIVTNGWIGGAYGYLAENGKSIDIWITTGETSSGSIDVYVQFIRL